MNILKTSAIVAVGLVALAACQQAPKNTAADESAIRESSLAWALAYNAGDADAVAALYAEDAVVLAPGAPAVGGRAAIREFIASDSAGTKAAGLTINMPGGGDVGMSGDLAWETGTFSVTDASGATVDAGKYLGVFQKKDGKWLLIRDTWNSDIPPTPAPAAEPVVEPAAS